MTMFLEDYVNMGLNDIIVLSSNWYEEKSGSQDEYTTEELVCKQNGEYYRIVIRTKQKFGWNAGKSQSVLKKTKISKEEYKKILSEKGGIEDTEEWRQKQETLRKLYLELESIDPICSNCGARMTERESRYGAFYGCSRYPKCENTMKISDADRKRKKEIYNQIAGSITKCNTWDSRKGNAILSGYAEKRIYSPVLV